MKRSITFTLLFAGLFLFSTNSFALFKGYVGIGHSFGDLEIDGDATSLDVDLDGTRYAGGFYLTPIPLVPLGIGATGEFADFRSDAAYDKRRLFTLRPELTAWLPLIKIKKLKPFVKLGYTLGWMSFEGEATDVGLKVNGVNASAGVRYSPLPLIEVLLQYNHGFEKAEVTDLSLSGVTSSLLKDGDEGDYKNGTVLISVQAGI